VTTPKINIRYRKDRGYYEAYYRDRSTGKRVVQSLDTANHREAIERAADWRREVESGQARQQTGWIAFRFRFEDEHHAAPSYSAALNHFEKLHGKPLDMNTINGSVMSELSQKLRAIGLGPERVGGVLRDMRVVLRFAKRIGVLREVPPIQLPKVIKRKLWRSRAISQEEFEAMLAKVTAVVGKAHAAGWKRFMRGLWLSGLRISEALRLSWDSPPLRVVMGERPKIIIFGEGQKSREDEVLPVTPDFAELLAETPARNRSGLVFPLSLERWKVTRENACRTIGAIGEAAGIKVDAEGKHATAHDFRRSFGHRWALRVRPVILQRLMRHKTLQTTMRYYVEIDDCDVSEAVWLPVWLPANGQKAKAVPKRPSKTRRK
jgi:integrase